MIEDIDKIINSVISKIFDNAIDLFYKLQKMTPFYYKYIIKQSINHFLNGLDVKNIEFDFDNNKLTINEFIIQLDDRKNIKYEIWKIKNNNK